MAPAGGSFLDTIWARLLAGLVALVFAGILAWINRDALSGPEAASGPLAECLAERLGDVDAMVADGVISDGQAAQFRIRARQLCEQTVPSASPPAN